MLQISKTVRLVTITGFVFALSFTGFASLGDDTAKKPKNQVATLEDVLGRIIEEGTATLLSSLHVGKGVEMSLWQTILSPESLTRAELAEFDGSVDVKGVLLVQLIVPKESKVTEKWRMVPFAEGVHIQVSYNVLKRNVDRPIALTYYIDARQARDPRVQLAAFFVFDVEKRTWSRVPGSPLRGG
jgi:hypothetical protein